MKKKILIGSLLVLTLLLLMPSIPAIQQKTIEDKAYSDFVEKLQVFNVEDIEILDDDIKFPLLFKLLLNYLYFRTMRSFLLILFSSYYDYNTYETVVVYPIIYQRALQMQKITDFIGNFFQNISDRYGFGWELYISEIKQK